MTCLLLLKGADPNLANKGGITPLTIAQRMGYTKISSVLIQCGSAISNIKETPIKRQVVETETAPIPIPNQGLFGSFQPKQKAPELIDPKVTNLIKSSMETGIMILPDCAYLGLEKELFAALRNETLRDDDDGGSTILMKAAYKGHLGIVKGLLERGCDIDQVDKQGNTAMVWACLGGRGKVVQELHDQGACLEGALKVTLKANIKIKGQISPLIASAYHGHQTIVQFLVKEGCDVNLRCGNGNGRSAIMVASWCRRKEVVKFLLLSRAYVDADVAVWLDRGIVYMKKVISEKNAWINVNPESMPFRQDQASRNDLSLSASASQLKRSSMQDKFVYFTSEEHDLATEIASLLAPRAGISVEHIQQSISTESISGPVRSTRQSMGLTKRNIEFRQGLNLDKIIGNNSEVVLSLAEQMPDHGTELDGLWNDVFQCVVQLVIAANKNIKHHFIAIAAKAIHCSAEIVRAIEQGDKRGVGAFCETSVRLRVKELNKMISTEAPRQVMLATRMAIGVWPPQDAVSNMIKEASALASSCRELVLLANTLGTFSISEKKFEVSFTAFEETAIIDAEVEKEKDSSLKGGLSYGEYKRQNDLKLIEEMSKNMGAKSQTEEKSNMEELNMDADFFALLDTLLKLFVGAVMELKQFHEQHLTEEFINATSTVYTRADNIMEETLMFELLRDISSDVTINEMDVKRLEGLGIRLNFKELPTAIKPILEDAIQEVTVAAKLVMARGKIASLPMASKSASLEMLQSSIPCLIAVKKLVTMAKEATVRVRHTGSEERRKKEAWRKECLANERVKQLFHMWESQVMGDVNPLRKNTNELSVDELMVLNDTKEGIIIDDGGRKIKGGRLGKLVEALTSHNVTLEEDFTAAFVMTHHSFTTSAALMDQLFKRYEITPPYGLNQRMFEIFLDKKVVQVRLKVCHVLLYWIQNHFEEDFADNEFLILRFRDFITKKVMFDFEQMGVQILDSLKRQLSETFEKSRVPNNAEKPKSLLNTTRFGADPIANLLTDNRAFLDIDPLEIARQLTIIEHDLYSKFQSYECLDQIWESYHRKEKASYKQAAPITTKRHVPGSPSSDISQMIRHTNEFTFWVATCIVNNPTIKGRVNALKYFVTMAQHCRELNNLTGVTTIVAGLSMGPVSRLHKTWKSFESKAPKLMELCKELQDLVSPKFQYANYRKILKEMTIPAIPFLGVFLTDLTFLDLGNQDFLPESHFINFDKRRKVFQLIREIQRFQHTNYALNPVQQIQDFMKTLGDKDSLNEDGLYEKSELFEPKEASSGDEEEDE